MPKFAARTFRRLTKKRGKATPGQPKVILWVDTFCEHFHPEVSQIDTGSVFDQP